MENQYKYPNVPGSKVPSGLDWINFAVDDALCDDDGPIDNSDQNIRWAIMRHLSDENNLSYASDYGAWNTWVDDTSIDGPYKGELHQYRRLIDSFSTFDLVTAGNYAVKWIHICEGEEMENQYKYPNIPNSQVPSGLTFFDFRGALMLYENKPEGVRSDYIDNLFFYHMSEGRNLEYVSVYGVWRIWADQDEGYWGELSQHKNATDRFITQNIGMAAEYAAAWIKICEGEQVKAHYTQEVTSNAAGEIVESRSTHQPGQESSVEIKQDAKGEPKVTVKVYHADPNEAAGKAVAIYYNVLSAIKVREENNG